MSSPTEAELAQEITETRDVHFEGIAASPGIVVGRAFVVDRRRIRTPKYHIDPAAAPDEVLRLGTAIKLSEHQLEEIKAKLSEEGQTGEEHLLILEAHRLMLQDEMLVGRARQLIEEEHINAEWAIRRTVRKIKKVFDGIDSEYFRERRGDVDFVGDRVVRNLMGQLVDIDEKPPEDAVVVAHDLSPADTVVLGQQKILGIVTDVGAQTSHSAIVARALEIPAVLGVGNITELCGQGDMLIVDGTHGVAILSPTPQEIDDYRGARRKYLAQEQELTALRDLPAETTDGHRIALFGNIEFAREVDSIISHGGDGVGLYRTEFLYLGRKALPSEQEHYEVYKEILGYLSPRPVTIRTFDLGGDKVPVAGRPREPNPAMGLRAMRFCLKEKHILVTQLRALLRAAPYGDLRVMFPMIGGVTELRAARQILTEARQSLLDDDIEHTAEIPIGVMIELPSAVMVADQLAREVDFFSIGTNDLIQYALGVDRQNREVAYLYKPLHPAVLRMIRDTVKAAKEANIPVSLCGEMGAEPLYTPILMALGLDSLSMTPHSIPIVKRLVRAVTQEDGRDLLEHALESSSADETERRVRSHLQAHYGDALE